MALRQYHEQQKRKAWVKERAAKADLWNRVIERMAKERADAKRKA